MTKYILCILFKSKLINLDKSKIILNDDNYISIYINTQ